MKVQALVATMFREDYSLLDELNIQSDVVVVNQCDREGVHNFKHNGYDILWIDSTERGLSRSRNMALKNASADICIICDDDERLADGYPEMIEKAYSSLPNSDFVVFNTRKINGWVAEKMFSEPERIGRFKTYGSVHITFRLSSIRKNNIAFDVRFGAGSGIYSCGEDAIFCMDCHKNKLVMYTYPGIICDVDYGQSTWFKGYNEKYFHDIGAYLAATFPHLKVFLKWYYPLRFNKLSTLGTGEIMRAINSGIRSFKLSYKDKNI